MTADIVMRSVPLGTPPGARARIGMIGLGSGMTTEREMHQIVAQNGVLLATTRVQDSDTVSLANLKAMQSDLMRAARTILPGERLDVIAYGCTSGAVAIGEATVAECIQSVRPDIRVTNQFRSSVDALRTLGVSRIALVCPYTRPVTAKMREHLEAEGFHVAHAVAFGLELGSEICGISADTVLAEAVEADRPDVDAVFVCCGGLRTIGIIEETERRLAKPVVSSNQSLAWHALRLAGIDDVLVGYGRLFSLPLLESQGRASKVSDA